MVSIQKISFRGENSTNLLTKYQTNNKSEVLAADDKQAELKKIPPSVKTSYVTSAIALASLGSATYIAVRNGKLSKVVNNLSSKLKNSEEEIINLKNELANSKEGLSKKIEDRVSDLGKWQDGQINGLREDLSQRIQHVVMSVQSAGMKAIEVSPVDINGMQLNLATVLNGYGKHTEELEKSLRSEATRRIFGFVDRSNITPAKDLMIRVPTSEFKGFTSTGGMSIVPKEVIANLGGIINNKQNAKLIVDTPLYLGQVEDNAFYSIKRRSDGLYDYISSKSDKPIAKLEQIDSMRIPVYTDKGKTDEVVDVFIAKDNEQIVDFELLKPWLKKDVLSNIENHLKKAEPFEINISSLKIKFDPDRGISKPFAIVKYDAVFYKHDKFRMNGPVFDGSAKNIYNNATHESGETERFIYFDKFFYEHLLKNEETSKIPLRADLIIGNDWQSGGISAMMKLLTTARKYSGLDPKVADKIYNTPIMTIMHNAGLSGDVWHSQPKLLNVMFGEHSAMITKNAWMPSNANLNGDSLNGLFHGTNLNPQTMAAAYSDVITPVSVGYGNEMASHSGFGGNNHDIFRMRGRFHEFSDIEHLKYIARQNGIDDKLVSENNIAYRPITNGCDRVNNMLTDASARKIEKAIGLETHSLRLRRQNESVYNWHRHNKEVYLNKVIQEVDMARAGKENPMNIELPELTNLSGVTKDTMVVSTAGRIVDQKGLDIFAEAIEEFLSKHSQDGNLPVFYAQGVGDKIYIDKLLQVKRNIAQKYGQQASDRIVFAKLFSEAGRYDGCKLMSDFTVMSSWFEPCGLVHKEIAAFSGAIPIVNTVGGLTDGLKDGVNAIFAKFMNKFENYNDALAFNRKAFCDAIENAYELFKDKKRFAEVLQNSYELDHSWLKSDGPMEKYAKTFVDLKVLSPEVLERN
ncbi:glycogen/starch synthase [bacterium]|nr:glycogen/starch synthase [bacterium]